MPKTVEEALTRGVEQILPSKKSLADLMRRKKIRLYNGIDPTGGKLHLGHTLVLRKLKQFQDLGHEVILLIGTFTAQIGDPSDRKSPRQPLTPAQIKKNMAAYKEQAGKILDLSKVKFVSNADWLAKLTFEEVIKLTSHFSVQQMIERDMFQRRLKENKSIWLHEFMYPLMQGYDSVHLDVDLEVGGTDQTFNMLAGRTLQKIYRQKEKYVLTTPMLIGLDGRKMSKTYGNTVNLTDPPNEMFGKLMSLKDELIVPYFELCTDLPTEKIKDLTGEVKKDPMGTKKELAHEITRMYHGEKRAFDAQREFEDVVQKKKLPSRIPERNYPVYLASKCGSLPTVLEIAKVAEPEMGTSAITRIIKQGGVEIDGEKIVDYRKKIRWDKDRIIKVGKRGYVKIKAAKRKGK